MSSRSERIIEKAFLGGEFLTWLWYACDQCDGRFQLGDDLIEVRFDDLLVLESLLADSQENTLKGGEPTQSAEARLGLQLGKKVSQAKLRLQRGEREYRFTIRGSTLDLGSTKLPAVLAKAEEEQFYERLYLLEELDRTVNELYLAFLRRRLLPTWESETLPALRAWIASPSSSATDALPSPSPAALTL